MSLDDPNTAGELTNLSSTLHSSDANINSSDEPVTACADDNLKLQDVQQDLAPVNAANDLQDPSSILIEILDPKGDLKLQIKDVVFLVSSNVLTLASNFFRMMLLKNAFAEGIEQPQVTDPPTKALHEKDTESFFLMLKLLHFQKSSPPADLDEFERFATVCDYYSTANALSAQAQIWVRPNEEKIAWLKNDDLERLIWVTYVFDLEDSFPIFARELASKLETEQCRQMSLKSMPEALEDDILKLRQNIHYQIRDQIEKAINGLRNNSRKYEMVGYLVCTQCSRQKPLETKRCGSCGGREFSQDHCQQFNRIEMLFKWLEKSGLWPTTARNRMSSRTMAAMMVSYEAHSCTGEALCPYVTATLKITGEIIAAPTKVKGLRLRDYRASGS